MPESLLDRGDRDAAASRWVAAVSSWDAALSTPDRKRAELRLHWFLESTNAATNSRHPRPRLANVPYGVGAALLGTVLVLLALEISSPWGNAIAVLAWILYIVAAGCGVLFAYQYRTKSLPPLTSTSISRARQLAEQVDAASATMPSGPRLPT